MNQVLRKWGNSLGVRIPKSILENTELKENSAVHIHHKSGVIVISPAKKDFRLDELLSKINSKNLHNEDDYLPEGNELW